MSQPTSDSHAFDGEDNDEDDDELAPFVVRKFATPEAMDEDVVVSQKDKRKSTDSNPSSSTEEEEESNSDSECESLQHLTFRPTANWLNVGFVMMQSASSCSITHHPCIPSSVL